jgi:hypothetical protein
MSILIAWPSCGLLSGDIPMKMSGNPEEIGRLTVFRTSSDSEDQTKLNYSIRVRTSNQNGAEHKGL